MTYLTNLRKLAEAATQRHEGTHGREGCTTCYAQRKLGERGSVVLAMLDVIEAAKAMREYPDWGLDRTEYDLAVFDAAITTFEKEQER